MLRWRLLIGTVVVAALIALCWADAHAARPGVCLAPLAVGASLLAAGEVARLGKARGVTPVGWPIYFYAALPVAAACVPVFLANDAQVNAVAGVANMAQLGWLAVGVIVALMLALGHEMRCFESPGRAGASLALSAFAILYVGGLLGMLVQLRLIHGPEGPVGIVPLASMIATVKLSDTCQYFVGRKFGRHKLAPRLSPGKTIEGAVGGIAIAVVIMGIVGAWLLPEGGFTAKGAIAGVGWAFTALAVAVAGLAGDLAESLLKRDAGVKDSSDWLPGFGGVLDMLDSLLLAAPVAYFCWVRWPGI